MTAKGNLTSYKLDPAAGNPTTFVWDFNNRLASADTGGDETADVIVRYDALGSVVERYAYTDHGKTTLFDDTGVAITITAYNPYTYTACRSI